MRSSIPNDIFNFMLVRPVKSGTPKVTINVDKEVEKLTQKALKSINFYQQMTSFVKTIEQQGHIIHSLSSLNEAPKIEQLITLSFPLHASIENIILNTFGKSIDKLSKDKKIIQNFQRLSNTVLAAKYIQSDYKFPLELIQATRWHYVILNYEHLKQTESHQNIIKVLEKGVIIVPEGLNYKPEESSSTTIKAQAGRPSPAKMTNVRRSSQVSQAINTNPQVRAYTQTLSTMKNIIEHGQTHDEKSETPFSINEKGRKTLSAQSLKLLKDKGITLEKVPLHRAVSQLEDSVLELDTSVIVQKPEATPSTNRKPNPSSYGQIKNIRISELLLTRQTLKAYEGGEIAHIENVLKGESKARTHTRSKRSVLEQFTQQEQSREDKYETSTTERYEVKKEVSREFEEKMKVHAETSLSIRGNPVTFSASGSFDWEQNKKEGRSVASKYAKDVVDKAVNNISQRVVGRTTATLIQEIIDENKHAFENIGGDNHVAGVYQWLNKVYEAQVYNYGWRVMLNLNIPDPSAFLRYAHENSSQNNGLDNIDPPPEFDIKPSDINRFNYPELVALYKASDVNPPDPYTKVVSKTFSLKDDEWNGKEKFIFFTEGMEFEIPAGYRAMEAHINWTASRTQDDFWVDVFVGDKKFHGTRRDGGRSSNLLLGEVDRHLNNTGDEGSIPIALQGAYVNAVTVTVYIVCRRTLANERQWSLETYEKLFAAYQERYREYEDKLSMLQEMPKLAKIVGRNPQQNKRIIQDEIKKHCISLVGENRFEHLDAMIDSGDEGPFEIDFDEAMHEGNYVNFFEEAFEWEHINYKFYPYFWNNKQQWVSRVLQSNNDPHFEAFIKAGYAGVLLPIRPGYERAVLYFMETGLIWNGEGEPPMVTTELYSGVLEEIQDRPTGEFDAPLAFGQPWTIKVPTSLVKLRANDDLPKWVKDEESHQWTPVEALVD